MSAYVALLLVDLHFPDAGSLKAKRKELQSVKAQLQGRLGCAVAEVDHQEAWQRSQLSVALTSGSLGQLDRQVDSVERWLVDRFPETVSVQKFVTSAEDIG
ncbi:MAG: DUF503 domain-containing protein [Solirubrobacteraceae bacterium]|jgi:Uncharacterized protein conserved in bacteria|nr:DUF503 domain-containing protein [Solirubrobacteraceae bacterium]